MQDRSIARNGHRGTSKVMQSISAATSLPLQLDSLFGGATAATTRSATGPRRTARPPPRAAAAAPTVTRSVVPPFLFFSREARCSRLAALRTHTQNGAWDGAGAHDAEDGFYGDAGAGGGGGGMPPICIGIACGITVCWGVNPGGGGGCASAPANWPWYGPW